MWVYACVFDVSVRGVVCLHVSVSQWAFQQCHATCFAVAHCVFKRQGGQEGGSRAGRSAAAARLCRAALQRLPHHASATHPAVGHAHTRPRTHTPAVGRTGCAHTRTRAHHCLSFVPLLLALLPEAAHSSVSSLLFLLLPPCFTPSSSSPAPLFLCVFFWLSSYLSVYLLSI